MGEERPTKRPSALPSYFSVSGADLATNVMDRADLSDAAGTAPAHARIGIIVVDIDDCSCEVAISVVVIGGWKERM